MPGSLLAPRAASFRTPQDTELAVSTAQLLGDVFSLAAGGQVTLTADVGHGELALAPDGSFVYRPDAGYVGPDSFRYVFTASGQTSQAVEVSLTIDRVVEPTPSTQDAFAIGSIGRGGPNSPDVTFGSLGSLSFSFEWLIPSLVVSVPGLLLLLVIGAQLLAGAAWLPLVRREVGDFGLGSRRRRRAARRVPRHVGPARHGRRNAPVCTSSHSSAQARETVPAYWRVEAPMIGRSTGPAGVPEYHLALLRVLRSTHSSGLDFPKRSISSRDNLQSSHRNHLSQSFCRRRR